MRVGGESASTAMSMASSNNSNSENKKIINGESSTPASKTKKDKKKLELSNGNSNKQAKRKQKEHDEGEGEGEGVEGGEGAKTHVFPMNRIRTMMKGEIPDLRVSSEAILAINKAAEKFLEQIAQDAYACSAQDRKKYLSYNHLSHVVSKQRRYDFLSDFVPEKVKAKDALRERNSRGNGGG